MSRREDVAIARSSTDLGDLAGEHSPVDILRAVGMVGQRFGVALDVWRVCDLGDMRAANPALVGLIAQAMRMGLDDPGTVGFRVLEYFVDPLCSECGGHRFECIAGTDQLSDRECQACGGTGKRHPGWGDAEMRLEEWVLSEQARAAGAIAAKLRG